MTDKHRGDAWIDYIGSVFDPIEMLQIILNLPEHLTDPKHAESGAAIRKKMEEMISDAETRRGGGDPWCYDPYTRKVAPDEETNS